MTINNSSMQTLFRETSVGNFWSDLADVAGELGNLEGTMKAWETAAPSDTPYSKLGNQLNVIQQALCKGNEIFSKIDWKKFSEDQLGKMGETSEKKLRELHDKCHKLNTHIMKATDSRSIDKSPIDVLNLSTFGKKSDPLEKTQIPEAPTTVTELTVEEKPVVVELKVEEIVADAVAKVSSAHDWYRGAVDGTKYRISDARTFTYNENGSPVWGPRITKIQVDKKLVPEGYALTLHAEEDSQFYETGRFFHRVDDNKDLLECFLSEALFKNRSFHKQEAPLEYRLQLNGPHPLVKERNWELLPMGMRFRDISFEYTHLIERFSFNFPQTAIKVHMSKPTRINYEFPTQIYLRGTGPNMENWNGQVTLPLKAMDEDNKVTFLYDLLPPYSAFEFKIILINKLGQRLWSNGENYKVQENGTIEVTPEEYSI